MFLKQQVGLEMVLAEWLQQLIDRKLSPLGLKEVFVDQIEVLGKEGADPQYIERNVERVLKMAHGNSRRYGKPEEYYLRRAVENEHLLHW